MDANNARITAAWSGFRQILPQHISVEFHLKIVSSAHASENYLIISSAHASEKSYSIVAKTGRHQVKKSDV